MKFENGLVNVASEQIALAERRRSDLERPQQGTFVLSWDPDEQF